MRGFAAAAASINHVPAVTDNQLVVAVVKWNGITLEHIKEVAADYKIIKSAFDDIGG